MVLTIIQGNTQGPFDSVKMFGWFKEGYFGMDLKIRRSTDTQFTQLGEIICLSLVYLPISYRYLFHK